MGCLTSNKPFDFGGGPAGSRIFVEIYAVTHKGQFTMIFLAISCFVGGLRSTSASTALVSTDRRLPARTARKRRLVLVLLFA